MGELEDFDTITIPDVSELPAEASAARELLQEQNIRSLIVTPMTSDEELIGFIGFDWLSPQDDWAEEFVDILHITGRLITSALQQESRRQELERREAYLEQSGDIISVVDSTGEIVYQSPSTEGATGFSPAEIVGQSAFEYVHPDERATIRSQFSSFVSQPGAERRAEFRIKTRGDSWTWIEVRAVNKLDDPTIEGVVFSSRDISARKAREQALKKYETIVDALGDPVYVLDDTGEFTYVNDAFVDLVEYDRETILGNSPSLIKEECAVEAAEQHLADLLSDDGPDTTIFDVTIHPRESEPLVCEDHMGVLSFEDDDFDGSVGTLRDVTTHRERITEVERLSSQYQTLVEHFPDGGVFLFDSDLQIIRAGGTELSTVGLSSDQIEGNTPHDLYPDEIADEHVQYFQQTLDGERHTYDQEYHGRQYEIRTIPVRNSDDEVTYGMAVSRDVTEERARKQELERQNEQLEEFASVVSHDLRNPLQVAEGRLELAQTECDSLHLGAVADALDRSTELIDDLLTLARGGDIISDPEPVSVATLARECWDVIPDAEATLAVETTQTVSADRSRLQQLLENLLINAVEHGGENVTVSVGTLSDGLYVADDGVGIPDGERDAIFEAGYSTTEDGTGFGMRIVKQVVDAHGWRIHVTESDEGGARVEITGMDVVESAPHE
jgi:PAS domain S-box-containing protein